MTEIVISVRTQAGGSLTASIQVSDSAAARARQSQTPSPVDPQLGDGPLLPESDARCPSAVPFTGSEDRASLDNVSQKGKPSYV